MLTEKEIDLITDLMLDEIDKEGFYTQYPLNLKENHHYFYDQFLQSIKEKNSDSLSASLDAMAMLEEYDHIDQQEIYKDLISKKWHTLHEELVDSIDKKIGNEDIFFNVLNTIYDYHKNAVEDFMVPIWSKCLWNLYKIGSEKAFDYIKEFQNSEYKYIRETVNHLLTKNKK